MDVTYLENLVEDRYAFLSVGWGLVADIDIESEKFRALGESRFTVQALQRVLGKQKVCWLISDGDVTGND